MERWLAKSVDLAGEAYAEFLEEIYQKNTLYRGEFTLGGKQVDPSDIDMPLLQILGQYDNLVPPGASKPFNEVVGSDRVTTIEYPTGHVGMAVSRSAHREVWPEAGEWFLDHSDRRALADVLAEGIEETLDVDVETDVTIGSVDDIEVVIADESGVITREQVARDTPSIVALFEEALDVASKLTSLPGSASSLSTLPRATRPRQLSMRGRRFGRRYRRASLTPTWPLATNSKTCRESVLPMRGDSGRPGLTLLLHSPWPTRVRSPRR